MFGSRLSIVKICKITICLFIVSWYECHRLLISSYINNNPDPSLYVPVKTETFCLCGILLGHRPTVWIEIFISKICRIVAQCHAMYGGFSSALSLRPQTLASELYS